MSVIPIGVCSPDDVSVQVVVGLEAVPVDVTADGGIRSKGTSCPPPAPTPPHPGGRELGPVSRTVDMAAGRYIERK